jgi:hypothetical protein
VKGSLSASFLNAAGLLTDACVEGRGRLVCASEHRAGVVVASHSPQEAAVLQDTQTTIFGEVVDVFGHRFVVRTDEGKILADLGPQAAKHVVLKEGDQIELSGDMKPSELKVRRIVKTGEEPFVVIWDKASDREQPED